jgi:hypothetical protein
MTAVPPGVKHNVVVGKAWRRVLRCALVPAGLLLACPLAAPSGAQMASASFHPPTGFGGYNWFGNVTQVSARWRVPSIASTSAAGHASTWIGAQDDDAQPPFIQLGTTEDKFSPTQTFYNAFWSDPHVGFHPQPIERIRGNDLVSAAMVRQPSGWELTFDDLSSGQDKRLTVHYGVGASFNQAEWLQEDPTADTNTAAVDLPYPAMATVTFHDLRVDTQVPSLYLINGATLLANGGVFLVPSAVQHDAFSLRPPRGAADSYLVAASKLDAVIAAFQVDTLHWTSLSHAKRFDAAFTLYGAYGINAFDLAFHRWPAKAHKAVLALFHQDQRVQHAVVAWTHSGLSITSNSFTTMSIAQGDGPLADQVRAELGLPPA